MRRADLVQAFRHDAHGHFGFVTFAAQMRQIDVSQISGHDFDGGLGGSLVGKMSVASQNPLLQTPGAPRFLKQFNVMVGFQNQHLRGAHPLNHQPGHVAEIRDKPEIPRASPQQITNGILRIVRNRKRFDG